MTAYLLDLSRRNDLKNVAQQPDTILLVWKLMRLLLIILSYSYSHSMFLSDISQVSCLLERLRGVATASEPRMQKAIYEMGFSVMNPILIFLDVYKHEVIIIQNSCIEV